MHILIAEDDAIFRALLETRLNSWGYSVVSTGDGAEALQILRSSNSPNIAILDWVMPGLDGVQVCRELRKDDEGPYVYVILVTAKGGRENIVEGMEAGADDYITKPLDAIELRARLGAGKRVIQLQQELIRARNAMLYQATHDALTGLWNRTGILGLLDKDLLRARTEDLDLSLLLISVDQLRSLNGCYGHPIMDMVLSDCARRIRHELPGVDTIGRISGKEFLVILHGTGMADATRIAEKVRSAITGTQFELGGITFPIDVRIGIADRKREETTDWASFLRSVESSLSRARREQSQNSAGSTPSGGPVQQDLPKGSA